MGYILILLLVLIPLQEAFTYQRIAPEPLTREVTSYTLGRVAENDSSPCIGAYNDNLCKLAHENTICASNELPKGTRLKVGETICIVMDKMNSRYKTRIDIATLDYKEALEFGKKKLLVYKLQ